LSTSHSSSGSTSLLPSFTPPFFLRADMEDCLPPLHLKWRSELVPQAPPAAGSIFTSIPDGSRKILLSFRLFSVSQAHRVDSSCVVFFSFFFDFSLVLYIVLKTFSSLGLEHHFFVFLVRFPASYFPTPSRKPAFPLSLIRSSALFFQRFTFFPRLG